MNKVSLVLGFIPDWNWETWDQTLPLFSCKYNYRNHLQSGLVTTSGHTTANTSSNKEKEIFPKLAFSGPFFVGRWAQLEIVRVWFLDMIVNANKQIQICDLCEERTELQDKRERSNCFNPIKCLINAIKETCISIRLCFKLLYSKEILPAAPPFSILDMTLSFALVVQSFCPT